ncbi:MAG: hypothetical protein JRI68_25205 [Deltaproteobacteria bacterium]|nr:hypothetical protein [Deltaproteobacteria bacterium]
MADDEDPSRDEAEDDALHEQSRAQLERLATDPKAQQLLQELEGDLAPGEDPAFWDVKPKKKGRRPAPESELAEHYDHVRPATPAKPDEASEGAEKVVLSAEARAAEVIAALAAEAGMDPEEFKKLPRGDQALKTAVSARRIAEAERTVSGTARLEKPAGLGEDVPDDVAQQMRDDGFDPKAKTVGGRTERGLPVPGEIGEGAGAGSGETGEESEAPATDDPEVGTPAASERVSSRPVDPVVAPDNGKQRRTMMLFGVVVIVVIALIFFVMHQPPRGLVGADGQPSAQPSAAASGQPGGSDSASAATPAPADAASAPAPSEATTTSSDRPEPSAAPATPPATTVGATTSSATATPPRPTKPRPTTHGPPRPTSSAGLYPDF